jgi:hypothetical protein
MKKTDSLGEIVAALQKAIKHGGMSNKTIDDSIKALSKLKYQYDDQHFPALENTSKFTDTSSHAPANLAEALLWKLGKWNSYKRFCAKYTNGNARPSNQDVVFFAFAKHLKDKNNPIYDQHAIRALWAICGNLTADERGKCKSLLFDGSNKWKRAGSGTNAIACYELFVRHLNDLVSGSNGASKGDIDRLLMPLGQAIKDSTHSYEDFRQLCSWSGEGKIS